LSVRENTLLSTQPYKMASDYMKGYLPNSDNISEVMQHFYSTTFNAVEKLAPTAEDLEKFGLDEPAHTISFVHVDGEGEDAQHHDNYVEFSAKTPDGIYYAYSPYYDMIVSIPESSLPFLAWEEIDWYERNYCLINSVAYIDRVVVESKQLDAPMVFDLDNSKSEQGNKPNSDKLEVYYNGQKVNYTLQVTKPSGRIETETSTYNFKRFVEALLSASLEGVATEELTEEQMEAFRQTPDSECDLKLTILLDDKKGTSDSTHYAVYRFYRYSGRHAYMTIELLDSPDAPGDPANAVGKFYVLRSFCDKLINDALRFVNGEEIVINSKY